MYKIGLSTCETPVTEELFKKYNKAGLRAMEISDTVKGYEELAYKDIAVFSKTYEVDIWSMHLPFPFSIMDVSNPPLASAAIEYYEELIKKGADIQCLFLFHSKICATKYLCYY